MPGGTFMHTMRFPRVVVFLLIAASSALLIMSCRPDGSDTSQPAYSALPWTRLGGPLGGIGYDIRYKFDEHDVWFVTDAGSGIYKSTDRGLTWSPSNEGIDARSGETNDKIPVFSCTIDPNDPDIIWIGTQYNGLIYKSTDGGETWIKKINGLDETLLYLDALSLRGFTVEPGNSNTVYCMGEISSYGWDPEHELRWGIETDKTKGCVYKSTDGGENWAQIWYGDNLARYCWIHPENKDILYVSTGIFDREAANSDAETCDPGGVGILKSTDGGATWTVQNEANGLTNLFAGSLYMHPDDPDTLFAATGSTPYALRGQGYPGGLFMTSDGGETWEELIGDTTFATVEICECDTDVIYAASEYSVYRSDDAGNTWQEFQREGAGTWGPDGIIPGFAIDMQCDPDDAMRIFINNYLGGNFLSTDGGETWVSASTGYTGAEILQVAIVADSPGRLYTGGRTGVFTSSDGGSAWKGLATAAGNFELKLLNEIWGLAIDPSDADHVLAAPNDLSSIIRSTDAGKTWNAFHLPVSPNSIAFAPSDSSVAYATLTPFRKEQIEYSTADVAQMDPSEYDMPGMGLWVSRTGGVDWEQSGPATVSGFALQALAVHPNDTKTVYAGRPTGELYTSSDSGASWTRVGNGLPGKIIYCISIDPDDPGTMYLGLEGDGLYRSTNAGVDWTRSASGLPAEADIRSIVIDPADTSVLYAGDYRSGVYVSKDRGTTWQKINDGLQNRSINVLTISGDGSVLYAGTMGDGVYRLGTVAE